MPTGAKHVRYNDDGTESPCRCTFGDDHSDLDLLGDSPKYCCGLIYEDGEDTCASCGESL